MKWFLLIFVILRESSSCLHQYNLQKKTFVWYKCCIVHVIQHMPKLARKFRETKCKIGTRFWSSLPPLFAGTGNTGISLTNYLGYAKMPVGSLNFKKCIDQKCDFGLFWGWCIDWVRSKSVSTLCTKWQLVVAGYNFF